LWTPSNITAAAWYDASDASTIDETGGAVSQWRDKSVNGRHVSQGTPESQPVYSANTISFDGTDDYLGNSSPFMWDNGSVDIYVVFKGTNTLYSRLLGEGNTGDANPFYSLMAVDSTTPVNLSPSIRDNSGGSATYADLSTGVFDDTKKLLFVRDTGTQFSSRVNGGVSTNAAYDRTGHDLTLNVFTIGAMVFGATIRGMDADINEMVFTYNLSDANRLRMEGYLAHKWGLAGQPCPGSPLCQQSAYRYRSHNDH
jgi:hypothetical protein